MRITGGKYCGRKIQAPRSPLTRPSTDRFRETAFSLLPELPSGGVLDICSGSGAMGIEAMSRGANFFYAIESHRAVAKTLKQNIRNIDPLMNYTIDTRGLQYALPSLQHTSFPLIIADPPYANSALYSTIYRLCAQYRLLTPNGLLMVEHDHRSPLPPPPYQLVRYKKIGHSVLSFYSLLNN
ncbi:MAG: 16S rRNA (guanine(966)-N(2))-methyltransferase RsmD [Chlamydiota bacterium]|nr:16S rRNA (guanine(966)-N(2))-methyltransferase RsmD [Chlamydiota bacterium]